MGYAVARLGFSVSDGVYARGASGVAGACGFGERPTSVGASLATVVGGVAIGL